MIQLPARTSDQTMSKTEYSITRQSGLGRIGSMTRTCSVHHDQAVLKLLELHWDLGLRFPFQTDNGAATAAGPATMAHRVWGRKLFGGCECERSEHPVHVADYIKHAYLVVDCPRVIAMAVSYPAEVAKTA